MNSLKGLVLGFIFVFAICGDALATTVQVGNCKSGFVNFTTINAAITASPNGTIILVCPGTYPEQVMINKPITIKGVSNGSADAAIIVPPSGGAAWCKTPAAWLPATAPSQLRS